ncbi:hypothetical protein [Streptomyces sp. NPDC051909]|uniref:MarR family winged helix-turn-helix transcriptional regulator n=1 Tax=Streptomyces sp. NPDC051909 TaxID=3154944 RepID=UPI00343814B9
MEDVRTQRPLGHWLKHIDGAIEGAMARLFAEEGLTRRDWQILNTVSYEPVPLSRIDESLAPFLSPTAPTVRPRVDALTARGWTVLAPDTTVTLTDEGHAAHRRIAAQVAALRTRITQCLSREEFGTLMTLLQRLGEHVDTVTTEPARGA